MSSFGQILTLLPLLVLAGATVMLMLVLAFVRSHRVAVAVAIVGLGLTIGMLPIAAAQAHPQVTALLVLDHYALFFIGLLAAASIAVALLAYPYFEQHEGPRGEFYLLLLLATLGSSVLAASTHFVSFFLGLEILSVSLYALIAYLRDAPSQIEAAVKYLVLAAVSAAFLLFGMALVYDMLGTMEFARIAMLWHQASGADALILFTGLVMVVVGIGFKLAVVPFHLWSPDVYEGAPAPTTAFIATISKGGMFALLLRLFTIVDVRSAHLLFLIFAGIAIASMGAGNLLALLQNNVKRILAYSSIAHFGFLLVAFLAGGTLGVTAASFYLVAYFITTLGAFGVVAVLSGPERDADQLEDYRGLYWRRPWLAGVFTAALFSLAGMPLTGGFLGEFYLANAGVGAGLWALVFVLVASSAVGLFYYLRIVGVMLSQPAEGAGVSAVPSSLSLVGGSVLASLTLALLWLGVYPTPLIHLIQATASRLG